MKNKIFLGGTCAETTWRDELISKLNNLDYFNPVVDDWTPECQVIERREKENDCNIHFYCITKEMQGVFSIAEVVDSVHNRFKRTILHVIPEGFEKGQIKSLQAVVDLINSRGGIAYMDNDISRSARVLNYSFSNYENDPKGVGLQESYKIRVCELTNEEAEQYGELMKQAFIQHHKEHVARERGEK
ncbi:MULTISPECIES: nucleoside 2-deoxyribosyltransferase domain-containing protein [Bacteria]|uniref:nucleoside 2-deoxyribosyltransferase domain-containing protein n=1 Tax=uncultured Acinetobacter sp. TaxID=165433 RepID=UPI00262D73E6|nr:MULTISPECIES: nucleoside 2-deoxyribosyltransferase domain-containing protein [Bacteria]